jgi:transposase-like protein
MGRRGVKPILSERYAIEEVIHPECPVCHSYDTNFKYFAYGSRERYICHQCGRTFYLSPNAIRVSYPPTKILKKNEVKKHEYEDRSKRNRTRPRSGH